MIISYFVGRIRIIWNLLANLQVTLQQSRLWRGLLTNTDCWWVAEGQPIDTSDFGTPWPCRRLTLLRLDLKSAICSLAKTRMRSWARTGTLIMLSLSGSTPQWRKWPLWQVTVWEFCIWQWAQMEKLSWQEQGMRHFGFGKCFLLSKI